MCGIVGYIGSEESSQRVVAGLEKLEYRGYDSAGIAVLDKNNSNEFQMRRKKGKLVNLKKHLEESPVKGHATIGHTRWATHGKPSEENAHPHKVQDIVLVHNGIIENYLSLKNELIAKGAEFSSETDSEVLAHLIAREEGTLLQRVQKSIQYVHGAFGIVVMSTKEPNTLIVAKEASPLVIGLVDNEGVVASDIPALLPYTKDVIILKDKQIAQLTPGSCEVWNFAGEKQNIEIKTIEWTAQMAEKGGYKHYMLKEIFEQPSALADTLRGRLLDAQSDWPIAIDENIVNALAYTPRILLTACGTSFHAAMVGRLMIEELAGIPADVALASELRYRKTIIDPSTLLMAVSQSGETADTLAAIKEIHSKGARAFAIVNVLESSIARECEWVFYTHAGPEIGVASTKAFVTQVCALALISIAVGRKRKNINDDRAQVLIENLRSLPRLIEEILEQKENIKNVAQKISNAKSALFLGRGYDYPVALEGALKLKEISYIHAEGYAAGEMKHGPIALVDNKLPCIFVASDSDVREKTLSNLEEVKAREGYTIAIATKGDDNIENIADEVIFVPKVDPLLAPLVTTVPLQLLSYYVADILGKEIDQPRNLAKSVTVE